MENSLLRFFGFLAEPRSAFDTVFFAVVFIGAPVGLVAGTFIRFRRALSDSQTNLSFRVGVLFCLALVIPMCARLLRGVAVAGLVSPGRILDLARPGLEQLLFGLLQLWPVCIAAALFLSMSGRRSSAAPYVCTSGVVVFGVWLLLSAMAVEFSSADLIGVRVPTHPVALVVIALLGIPVVLGGMALASVAFRLFGTTASEDAPDDAEAEMRPQAQAPRKVRPASIAVSALVLILCAAYSLWRISTRLPDWLSNSTIVGVTPRLLDYRESTSGPLELVVQVHLTWRQEGSGPKGISVVLVDGKKRTITALEKPLGSAVEDLDRQTYGTDRELPRFGPWFMQGPVDLHLVCGPEAPGDPTRQRPATGSSALPTFRLPLSEDVAAVWLSLVSSSGGASSAWRIDLTWCQQLAEAFEGSKDALLLLAIRQDIREPFFRSYLERALAQRGIIEGLTSRTGEPESRITLESIAPWFEANEGHIFWDENRRCWRLDSTATDVIRPHADEEARRRMAADRALEARRRALQEADETKADDHNSAVEK